MDSQENAEPLRLADARRAFDTIIEREVKERGMLRRLDRVALVGFSQGASLSLDAVISGRWRLGGVVSFAGRLLDTNHEPKAIESRILLVHGQADATVPHSEVVRIINALRSSDALFKTTIVDSLGHAVSEEAAIIAAEFLANIFHT